MSVYANGAGKFIDVDGMLVEEDALKIAEAIDDYDPNIKILCVNPGMADISEAPFVIAELCSDGILRPIFTAWCLDGLVLERIKNADGHRYNGLETLQEMEANIKKENTRRYEEKREELKDITYHISGMKSRYSVRDSNTGELITFFDDRPATRK